jgi:AcrR family transcriptional regulator
MPERLQRRRGRPPSGGREAIVEATLRLLRERGIARLTTREVARCAGVSEASVFYHYHDRAGLLAAAFAQGLAPLQLLGREGFSGADRRAVLRRFGAALERFLDEVLPVLAAAQADAQLRQALADFMREHRAGPHRGVDALARYLAAEQAAGRARADVDAQVLALSFIGACTTRAMQRHLAAPVGRLPSLERVVEATDAMLSLPPGPQRGS